MEGIVRAEAIGVAVLAAVVVPVFEELVFRGWLQPLLSSAVGSARGLVVVAVAFTVIHDHGVWLPILVLAILLGVLRERTQSLWPCIAVHIVHNSLQVTLFFAGLQ